MKVLITGGSGFIGSHLSEALALRGWEVRVLDRRPPRHSCSEYICADLLDSPAVLDAMADVQLVVHLAASHRFFGVPREEFYRNNVDGTSAILEAATRQSIRDIVFYSSAAVYGQHAGPTDENTPPDPSTPYGTSKLQAEQLLRGWVADGAGRNTLVIRPTVIFGPGNQGNVYRLIRQIDSRLFIPIGRGQHIKSVAYIGNLLEATLFLLDKGLCGFEVYNYSDEPQMSFARFVALVHSVLGRDLPKFSLPAKPLLGILKPFDLMARVAGADFPLSAAIHKMTSATCHTAPKIRSAGFRQPYSLEEGLTRTIQWYRSHANASQQPR